MLGDDYEENSETQTAPPSSIEIDVNSPPSSNPPALSGDINNNFQANILQIQPLEFESKAQVIRQKLEAKHLKLQSLESINRKLASHIGKYDGLFARLCIVWHCIENCGYKPSTYDRKELPAKVTEHTTQPLETHWRRECSPSTTWACSTCKMCTCTKYK